MKEFFHSYSDASNSCYSKTVVSSPNHATYSKSLKFSLITKSFHHFTNLLTLLSISLTYFLIVGCSKYENLVMPATESDNVITESSNTATYANDSNVVSIPLLQKYLNTVKKNKTTKNINSIVKEDKIVAYYVEYENNKGWDIICADKRNAPILASGPEGSLNLNDTINPAILAVKRMIDATEEIDLSTQRKNSIWEFIEPNNKIVKKKGSERDTNVNSRGCGAGMWVPIDTTYEVVTTSSSRVTSTAWGQFSPWNNFTPYKDSLQSGHCPVGCTPVAVGQLLYKYIAPNPGQHTIPTSATPSLIPFAPVTFSQFSNSAWSDLILNAYHTNIYLADQTSIFLSWIGNQMNSTYMADTTGTDMGADILFLRNYLNFTSEEDVKPSANSREYFCTQVVNSIGTNSPVLISAMKNKDDKNSHSFLIDGWQRTIDRFAIRYEFDPDYQYTYEELDRFPVWMFDFPPDYGNGGIYERYDYLELYNALYLKMNWGWQDASSSSNYNNYSFLVRSESTNYIDGQPVTHSIYYNFSWNIATNQYNFINDWHRHFSKKTQ